MKSSLLLLTLLGMFISGCVGTVQDTQNIYTKASDAPEKPLSFAGVHSVSAISDSRIEVFFYPATGGSGIYTYDIMVGSSPFPVSIPSDVLTPDYRGMLRTTLTGLSRLTAYQIKVEVRDGESQIQSDSEVMKSATTFDNQVADFNGISSASNTPGQDGKDSIKVRWTPARTSGGLTKQEWDPVAYEVVLVDAERLTPNDMDIPYSSAEGRWVYSFNHEDTRNEYIIRGLPSETKFYVRMRAIHFASIDDVYNPKKRSELNTTYVTISTLSSSLADINFQTDSFALALAPGEQGLSAIQASWTMASGVFDHYRLYYGQTGGGVSSGSLPSLCLSPILSPGGSNVFCKKADFNKSQSLITGLLPYTDYEVVLVLCATTTCGPAERIVAPVRSIKTDPTSPSFNGVKEVREATNLADIGTLYLQYDIPNFSTGYFDGLILKVRRTLDGSDVPVEITRLTSPIYHNDYNFLAENQLIIKGVNYLDTQPFCFTLYPFKWESNGVDRRESPNDIWKCIQPKIEAPTALQFPGLAAGTTENNSVTLQWSPPTKGMFAEYELFWRKQPGAAFNWGTAIAEAGNNFDYTNYGRMLIDADTTQITIDGFANGEYTFGIITHYNYVTDLEEVTMRSETNSNLKRCTIDDTAPGVVLNCNN